MPDTIEAYVAELKEALAGADPALVQDAVYDAEEYLRSAAAEGGGSAEAVAAAIDAYGTPTEIAQAYRDTERTVVAALRRPAPAPRSTNPLARFFGVIADPAAWGALFYLLLSAATGVVYFIVVTTGLALSLGLIVLIIGLPVALLFVGAVRAISLAEGRMVEGLLGVRMPRRPRSVTVQGSLWARLKGWFADYRTWTTMLYMLLMLPLGLTYFIMIVTALSLSLALFVLPIAQFLFHIPVSMSIDGGATYGYYLYGWSAPLVSALGIIGFFVTMWIARGIGYVHGLFAKVMLVGRFEGEPAPAVGPVSGPAPVADAPAIDAATGARNGG